MRNGNTSWTALSWNSGRGAWSGQHQPPMVFEVRYSKAAPRERRSEARVATALTAFYGGSEKKFHQARLVDLSPSGARLHLEEQVAPGCQLEFTLRLGDVVLQISGHIVWQGRQEAGIRLVGLDRSTRVAVQRWCRGSGDRWHVQAV